MDACTVVLHGLLIQGTGADPVPDSAVLIRGRHIEAVGRASEVDVPAGAEVIDATGKAVLPGIIEGHAHVGGPSAGGALAAQRVLRLSLQRGITTVCSVDADTSGIRLRDAIEEGQVRGCARLVAGCVVACTNGHVKGRAADGPWEVRKAVREAVMAGADFIKTAASGGFVGKNEVCSSPNYSLEELAALTAEAHAWDVPVVVHCHTQPGLRYCIEAGVDQIHHGAFIDEAAVRGIKDRELFYMPTLSVTCDRNVRGLSDQPWQTKEMIESQPVHRAGVRLAHELGVELCVGTDYPGNARSWDYGDRTLFELQELVRCGLTPMEAIVAATRNNAAAYRLFDELGTVEPGKKADILVVTGNPAVDVNVLYEADNINVVLKDGVVESTDEAHQPHYRLREDLTRGPRRAGRG